MEAADTAYPILLDAEGRLLDGMHRAVKRLSQGHSDIRALQFARTPEPDFVGVAAGALPYEDPKPWRMALRPSSLPAHCAQIGAFCAPAPSPLQTAGVIDLR